jgi:hypothetical protein
MNHTTLPNSFWISLFIFVVLSMSAWIHRSKAWGIPALGVYATVMAWYHLDVVFNDYTVYTMQFSPHILDAAWWQVIGFAVSFAIFVPLVHGYTNWSVARQPSLVTGFLNGNNSTAATQQVLVPACYAAAAIWLAIWMIALVRTSYDWQGLFFPWLGHKAYPWSRGRMGSGFDFLISFVLYINMFCLGVFGVVAALAMSRKLQCFAVLLMVLSWPYVMIDRTRYIMLVVALPAILSFVFIRLRGRRVTQVAVLLAAVLVVEGWMHHVFEKRSNASLAAVGANAHKESEEARHLGLNMYEELCWINTFFGDGAYSPNWGKRYFAELVNPIPRSLWKGKPMIGIDYAIARGQGGGIGGQAGVNATISTGLIGQGVVNFGVWCGPIAAAFLTAIWVAFLARLDLTASHFGRIMLYLLGLVLTFVMGRDLSLLAVYPLLFGYVIVRFIEPKSARSQ